MEKTSYISCTENKGKNKSNLLILEAVAHGTVCFKTTYCSTVQLIRDLYASQPIFLYLEQHIVDTSSNSIILSFTFFDDS